MIVDVSSYVGYWPYWDNPYADENGDGLLTLMDRCQIDMALVVATKGIFYDVHEGNNIAFRVAGLHGDRIVPTVSINPMSETNIASYLRECLDRGARAVRLYPYYHGYRLRADNPALASLVEEATGVGCPIMVPLRVLMNWGFYSLPSQEVVAFVKAFPQATFVLGSFNYSEFYDLLALCKSANNTFLDTACLTMMLGIERLVAEIPAERLLCGTGSPLQNPACGLIRINQANVEEEIKASILGFNATSVFKL